MRALHIAYYLLTALAALASSLLVFLEAFSLAGAYGSAYVTDEIYYVDSARRLLERVFGLEQPGEYSGKTREDYYNLEHPPLGKYIIALGMLLCGDQPLCWRLPGVLLGSLMPLVLYAAYASSRHPAGPAAGAVAAIALAADPIVARSASVAMLDIYLSFFTALSIALAVRGNYLPSLLAAALSLNVKISGAGTMLGSVMNLYRLEGRRERLKLLAIGAIATAALSLLLHAPLMAHFGPLRIAEETVGAVRWHLTSRPPDGPPSSSPSGWILNVAPFVFSYDPRPVLAEVNTAVHLVALAFSVYALLLGLWGRLEQRLSSPLFYAAITLAYWSVFLAGNRTLYSFYAVQLSPAAAGAIAELVLLAWDKRGLKG